MATVASNPTAFGYSDDVESLETVQSILAHLDLADPTDGPSWQGGSPALANLLSPQEVPGRLPTPTAFRPQPIARPLNGGRRTAFTLFGFCPPAARSGQSRLEATVWVLPRCTCRPIFKTSHQLPHSIH
eukprot:TRINITY_DN5090_c0_g1_i1.p6 TRINITY_DN5090_c0_g1~~TRINITY_DN5090_c0_g1_i1.p6  ORF type:complete len:136 (-),score=16.88 TRINITY_DN5090_c0_g1_i1:2246-2632(-)